MTAECGERVLQIKESIEQARGIPIAEQTLAHGDAVLTDNLKLGELCVDGVALEMHTPGQIVELTLVRKELIKICLIGPEGFGGSGRPDRLPLGNAKDRPREGFVRENPHFLAEDVTVTTHDNENGKFHIKWNSHHFVVDTLPGPIWFPEESCYRWGDSEEVVIKRKESAGERLKQLGEIHTFVLVLDYDSYARLSHD